MWMLNNQKVGFLSCEDTKKTNLKIFERIISHLWKVFFKRSTIQPIMRDEENRDLWKKGNCTLILYSYSNAMRAGIKSKECVQCFGHFIAFSSHLSAFIRSSNRCSFQPVEEKKKWYDYTVQQSLQSSLLQVVWVWWTGKGFNLFPTWTSESLDCMSEKISSLFFTFSIAYTPKVHYVAFLETILVLQS